MNTIYYNGKIYTVDEKRPWAEAVLISGNKIAAVGADGEILSKKDSSTKLIDLDGKMMLPGFIDSHAHPSWGGTEMLYKVSLFDCKSEGEYISAITDFVAKNPTLAFIQGVGWVNPHFDECGPSRKLLDAISSEIPMVFDSADHHSIWANSKAIEMAGITAETACAEGGVIEKDKETGEPFGTFRESAQDLIKKIIPAFTKEEYMEGILAYQERMASYGITMAHDAMVDGNGPAHEALITLDKENKMLFKMAASFTTFAEDPLRDAGKYEEFLAKSNGNMFKAHHVKFFIDGVVEASTAYLKKPYANNPNYCGEAIWREDNLKELALIVDRAGLTPHFHVIGDRAIDQMLTVLEYVEKENGPKERRPLAAHMQILDPEDIPRLKYCNIYVSANPYWFVKEPGYYYKLELPYLGEERASKEYPMKVLFDNGIVVASASDFSVTPVPKPLRGIQMGMNRCFPEMDSSDPNCVLGESERVTLKQMIESFTINGAMTVGLEDVTGSIEEGKTADLVILEKNLFEIPKDEIAFTKVIAAISEGKVIYEA